MPVRALLDHFVCPVEAARGDVFTLVVIGSKASDSAAGRVFANEASFDLPLYCKQ